MINLTRHIGTELHGIQLTQLTDHQKDELGLLIAERSVVFFRDQDISPQQQKELGEYFGVIEVHPQVPQVPGSPGVTVMWPDLSNKELGRSVDFRNPGGAAGWHTDLVHEAQPAGVTHLHNDTVPDCGGDTIWSSGQSIRIQNCAGGDIWLICAAPRRLFCLRQALPSLSSLLGWEDGHISLCAYLPCSRNPVSWW